LNGYYALTGAKYPRFYQKTGETGFGGYGYCARRRKSRPQRPQPAFETVLIVLLSIINLIITSESIFAKNISYYIANNLCNGASHPKVDNAMLKIPGTKSE
jgi:hypothetical protein